MASPQDTKTAVSVDIPSDEKQHVAHADSHEEDLDPVGIAAEIAHEVNENSYSPWTKSMFQLYGVLFVACK